MKPTKNATADQCRNRFMAVVCHRRHAISIPSAAANCQSKKRNQPQGTPEGKPLRLIGMSAGEPVRRQILALMIDYRGSLVPVPPFAPAPALPLALAPVPDVPAPAAPEAPAEPLA